MYVLALSAAILRIQTPGRETDRRTDSQERQRTDRQTDRRDRQNPLHIWHHSSPEPAMGWMCWFRSYGGTRRECRGLIFSYAPTLVFPGCLGSWSMLPSPIQACAAGIGVGAVPFQEAGRWRECKIWVGMSWWIAAGGPMGDSQGFTGGTGGGFL